LSKKIRNLLEKEHLGGSVEVATLHSYAKKIIESAGLKASDEGIMDDGYFRRVYPKLFFEALLSTISTAPFDYLVVDEGQDLKYKAYLDMFDLILVGGFSQRRWLWMEDDQQNLFNLNREQLDADLMQYSPTVCYLTKNCRNTLPISTFASLVSGFDPQECLLREGPEVKIFFYTDMEGEFDEVEKEVNKLIGEGLSSDDIVILIPVSLEKSFLHDRKSVAGLSLVPYDPTATSQSSIRYCTIQSFKGLESKALIVADILDLDADYSRYVNYVGLSRAMSWLSIMISEKAKGQYSDKVKEYGEKLSARLGSA
jgi:superfamily I DNA and RNA helicase